MNERATPETNASEQSMFAGTGHIDRVTASFARRLERERDEAREALLKVLPYMRVDTPNACAAFDNARAILTKVKS